MSSNLKGRKKGVDWEGRIFFINNINNPNEVYNYSEMRELVKMNETIIRIWKYKEPLFAWQLTSLVMYHEFIVFETDDWYWSVEKNGSGIWIQKSDDKSDVVNEIGKIPRLKLTLIDERFGRFITIQDLMQWINENELDNPYSYIIKRLNCKGFAERLFNFIITS